jgi:hypothetical protein
MLRRSREGHASTTLLAVYLICVVFVFSFILFEVLDIDGSDFPVAPRPAVTLQHPAEASHDIKRTHLLAGQGQPVVDLQVALTDGASLALRLQRPVSVTATASSSPAALVYRITLARSSLADASASA